MGRGHSMVGLGIRERVNGQGGSGKTWKLNPGQQRQAAWWESWDSPALGTLAWKVLEGKQQGEQQEDRAVLSLPAGQKLAKTCPGWF